MNRRLTKGQATVLTLACLPMIAVGSFGAWGTYSNVVTEFGRAATAIGVVAAGEGVVLILALVMVGLTMLGQAAPAPVRAGLWLAPLTAAVTGMVVADDLTERVVYAITPLAMSAAAEGLGLLARRIVVYRTGVDVEVQRRNATTVQRLAYHQARAANHPDEGPRKRSERAAWRLAARVGEDDAELGTHLVQVQRDRLRQGADAALAGMLTVKPAGESATPEVTLERADAADAPQLLALPPATVAAAVIEAASTLGEGAKAREIAEHLAETRRLIVDEPYIRTALSREAKRQQEISDRDPMRGGYV